MANFIVVLTYKLADLTLHLEQSVGDFCNIASSQIGIFIKCFESTRVIVCITWVFFVVLPRFFQCYTFDLNCSMHYVRPYGYFTSSGWKVILVSLKQQIRVSQLINIVIYYDVLLDTACCFIALSDYVSKHNNNLLDRRTSGNNCLWDEITLCTFLFMCLEHLLKIVIVGAFRFPCSTFTSVGRWALLWKRNFSILQVW